MQVEDARIEEQPTDVAAVEQATSAPAAKRPALWGGQFPASRLGDFLAAWTLDRRDMPWRLWEWISDIALAHVKDPQTQVQALPAPDSLAWLERGRAFGSGGDLSIRRDGDCVYWRFIGPSDSKLPTGFKTEARSRDTRSAGNCGAGDESGLFAAADFWASEFPSLTPGSWALPNFAEWQATSRGMLLWGQERRDAAGVGVGTWQEDRVGGVLRPLVYPCMTQSYTGNDNRLGRVMLRYREYTCGDNVEAVWWLALEPLKI